MKIWPKCSWPRIRASAPRRLGRPLLAGAKFELWLGASSAAAFRSVFRRRQRSALRAGQPSIGFDQGLRDLDAYEGAHLVLGHVDDRPRGGYYFQLFLTPDLSRLVACFGVKPSSRVRPVG
ncbi:hypothetical protein [Amycolatopsis sp. FDAARGOS 1241]|uniref:hypothetical protein n=1 Tax=Amycolatopsis sp. FDAARGOS 1241 TaxID=2778070 RepID=UPI00194E2FBA|nr:hypothetical protein [Amycolatopsis sp. FDAARGOS 1241]QRP44312.1 hypothetical protein I6J71_34305 [Amycolatopsis sp. FDAARGOS 1241]